jgi:hypothetical protein
MRIAKLRDCEIAEFKEWFTVNRPVIPAISEFLSGTRTSAISQSRNLAISQFLSLVAHSRASYRNRSLLSHFVRTCQISGGAR